jgi:hypothetical protein
MAQTDDGKKRVYVRPHDKKDGTKIAPHYRTPPCPTPPPKKTK